MLSRTLKSVTLTSQPGRTYYISYVDPNHVPLELLLEFASELFASQ